MKMNRFLLALVISIFLFSEKAYSSCAEILGTPKAIEALMKEKGKKEVLNQLFRDKAKWKCLSRVVNEREKKWVKLAKKLLRVADGGAAQELKVMLAERVAVRLKRLTEVMLHRDRVEFVGEGWVKREKKKEKFYERVEINLKEEPKKNAQRLKDILIRRIPEGNFLNVTGKGLFDTESTPTGTAAVVTFEKASYQLR